MIETVKTSTLQDYPKNHILRGVLFERYIDAHFYQEA